MASDTAIFSRSDKEFVEQLKLQLLKEFELQDKQGIYDLWQMRINLSITGHCML